MTLKKSRGLGPMSLQTGTKQALAIGSVCHRMEHVEMPHHVDVVRGRQRRGGVLPRQTEKADIVFYGLLQALRRPVLRECFRTTSGPKEIYTQPARRFHHEHVPAYVGSGTELPTVPCVECREGV